MDKPKLPEDIPFPDETVKWFESWRNSSRSDDWDELQWQYLIDTALVHSAVWGSQDFSMLGELHKRLAYMGLTFAPQTEAPKEKHVTTTLEIIQNRRRKKCHVAEASGQ
jgi:hypothetical protein